MGVIIKQQIKRGNRKIMITTLLAIGIFYWAACAMFLLGAILSYESKSGWEKITFLVIVGYFIGLLASGVLVPFILGAAFDKDVLG
jgi:hypothetical protein